MSSGSGAARGLGAGGTSLCVRVSATHAGIATPGIGIPCPWALSVREKNAGAADITRCVGAAAPASEKSPPKASASADEVDVGEGMFVLFFFSLVRANEDLQETSSREISRTREAFAFFTGGF